MRALDLALEYNFIIIFFMVVAIAAFLSDNFLTFRNGPAAAQHRHPIADGADLVQSVAYSKSQPQLRF